MEIYIEDGYEAVAKAIVAAVAGNGELSVRRRIGTQSTWVAWICDGGMSRNGAEMGSASVVGGMYEAASGRVYPAFMDDESIWDTYGRHGWEWAHWVMTGVWRGPENLHPEHEAVAK